MTKPSSPTHKDRQIYVIKIHLSELCTVNNLMIQERKKSFIKKEYEKFRKLKPYLKQKVKIAILN